MKKKIYLVLTQTNTVLATTIKKITKKEYSHASLSFNEECSEMYSFGRKYTKNPFIGVFKKENIKEGLFLNNNSTMAIYEIKINERKYHYIKRKIKKIKKNNKGYNIFGLLIAIINLRVKRQKYYCSEFVYEVLVDKKIKLLSTKKGAITPNDLLNTSNIKLLYEGKIANYNV